MAAVPRSSSGGRALATLAAHLRPAAAAVAAEQPALRHIVCFRFSPSATDSPSPTPPLHNLISRGVFPERLFAAPAQKNALVAAFTALPAAIPTILTCEFSLNAAGPKYAEVGQGFTHCFCLTFGSEADRDAYLPHPEVIVCTIAKSAVSPSPHNFPGGETHEKRWILH